MKESMVLSCRARLARNYADQPFDVSAKPEAAAAVISRTVNALENASGEAFTLHPLRDMTDLNRRTLVESGRISADMLRAPDTAAVLLSGEGEAAVMLNGTDQVAFTATMPGLHLMEAALKCFRLDDCLSRKATLAYDEHWGYLTASPADAGTGLKVTVRLHLPLLTAAKKLANAPKKAASAGLRLTGALGSGPNPPADLWEVSNLAALGRTEQDIIALVTAAARQFCETEMSLWQSALAEEQRTRTEDRVWRALALMQHARLMPITEFWPTWSSLRLGAAMGLLPLTAEEADALLPQAMPAHLCTYAGQELSGESLDACRAERLREMLTESPLI